MIVCLCKYTMRVYAVRTVAGGVCSGPGESVLTHSGSAALQLIAAGAGELTCGAVVVFVTVTLHVTVVRGEQWAAAAHCTDRKDRGRLAFYVQYI